MHCPVLFTSRDVFSQRRSRKIYASLFAAYLTTLSVYSRSEPNCGSQVGCCYLESLMRLEGRHSRSAFYECIDCMDGCCAESLDLNTCAVSHSMSICGSGTSENCRTRLRYSVWSPLMYSVGKLLSEYWIGEDMGESGHLKVLSLHLPGKAEENYEQLQSR